MSNDIVNAGVLIGKVVSTKMNKSISVKIERYMPHPVYGKYIKKSTKLLVHDENEIAKEGDNVEIVSSRPISKRKAWTLKAVIEKGR